MVSSPDRRLPSNFFGLALAHLIARWREWTASDRYRPEKHYMRGPGPKNLANSAKTDNDPKPHFAEGWAEPCGNPGEGGRTHESVETLHPRCRTRSEST